MKSVLVIDTPESCSECKLSIKGMRICLPLGEYCHKGEIHPQCPLKQLPSKEEIVSKYIETTNGQLNGKMMNFIDLIYSDNKEEKE